ncbi:MAG: cytochrome P450 [Pseudomonadota bacterium]
MDFEEATHEHGMQGIWAITRHDDITAVSRDAKTFCSGLGTNIIDQTVEEARKEGWLLNMDAPEHFQMRKIVSSNFAPRNVELLKNMAQHHAARLVDAVADSGSESCDFFQDIASPYPVSIIQDFLGSDPADGPYLQKLTVTALAGDASELGGIEAANAAFDELNEYGKQLAKDRRAKPQDDIVSKIIAAEVEGRKLSDEEVGYFFQVLVTAGIETTGTVLTRAIEALIRNPSQMQFLRVNFDEAIKPAVEELARWASPLMYFRRTATCDTEIRGQGIRKGDKVVMWYASGNFDERVFHEPHTLDLTRSPNPHMAFGGGGKHTCLGAHLARMDMPILLKALFDRFVNIELDGEPKNAPSRLVNAITSLPIRFDVR